MGQGPPQRDMVHPNRTGCTLVLSSFTRDITGGRDALAWQ